jgi:hypothetical protein
MFNKGLWRDGHPQSQPEGSYRDALNLSLKRRQGSLTQEEATVLVTHLPEGHRPIGKTQFSNGEIAIFSVGGLGETASAEGQIEVLSGATESGSPSRTDIVFQANVPPNGEFATAEFSLYRSIAQADPGDSVAISFYGTTVHTWLMSDNWDLAAAQTVADAMNSHMDLYFDWSFHVDNTGAIPVVVITAKTQGDQYNNFSVSVQSNTWDTLGTITAGGLNPDRPEQSEVVTINGTNINLAVNGGDTVYVLRDRLLTSLLANSDITDNFIVGAVNDGSGPRIGLQSRENGPDHIAQVSSTDNNSLGIIAFHLVTEGVSPTEDHPGIIIYAAGNAVTTPGIPSSATVDQVAGIIRTSLQGAMIYPWAEMTVAGEGAIVTFVAKNDSDEYNGITVTLNTGTSQVQATGSVIDGGGEIGFISEIGIFDGKDYRKLLNDGDLDGRMGFRESHPIQSTTKTDPQGNHILYWVDGINPPRRLNVTTLVDTTLEEMQLFPGIGQAPRVAEAYAMNSGGILNSGSYHVAFALVTNEGDETPYLLVTQPITVIDSDKNQNPRFIDGCLPDIGTSKSILVAVENIDPRYSYIQPALIRGTDVRLLSRVAVGAGSAQVIVTGGEAYTPGDLGEVLVNNANYTTAKAIAQQDGILYLGNLKKAPDIGYQKFANSIRATAVEQEVPVVEKWGFNTHNWPMYTGPANDARMNRHRVGGFKRGEVYAFYISLILKDGSETPAYHIPGRAPVGSENLTPEQGGPVFLHDADARSIGATKKFQVETGHRQWGFGYWENENETYPTSDADYQGDFEVWNVDGDGNAFSTGQNLHGSKVRHHAFPDNYTKAAFINGEKGNVYGVKFSNIRFPREIKDQIVGYRIHYARRDERNGRWIDQSPLFVTDRTEGHYKVKHYHDTGGVDTNRWPLQFVYPFHLMRTRKSAGIISYIKQVARSANHRYGAAGGTDPYVLIPENYNQGSNHLSRVVDAGYIEMNTNVYFGSGNMELVNTYAPDGLCLEVANPWDWHYEIVDIMSFKLNVYQPFYAQELVFTGFIGDVDQETTGPIFGGDTYLCFYGQILTSPTHNGTKGKRMIHQSVVECRDIIGLRHEGEEQFESYWPKNNGGRLTHGNYFTQVGEDEPLEATDYIAYNDEYSNLNTVKPSFPYHPYEKRTLEFPTRVIRSVGEDMLLQKDNFRRFLENDYLDFPRSRGELIKISGFQGMILAHMRRGLFQTVGREELIAGDIRAYVGAGDIFSQPPREIFTTDEGYGGIQNPNHAVLTPAGYFFLDLEAKKLFQLSDGLKEISGLGLEGFFKENLIEGRYRFGYDPRYHRIFFSRADEAQWGASFLPDIGVWESFHSGNLREFFWNSHQMWVFSDGAIYRKNAQGVPGYQEGLYFGETQPFIIEVVDRQPKDEVVHSALIDVTFLDSWGEEDTKECFSEIRVSSDHQDSGPVAIVPFPDPNANARRTNRVWKINKLRDGGEPNTLNGTLPAWVKRRLNGKHHTVKLTYSNLGNKILNLFGVTLNNLPSIR